MNPKTLNTTLDLELFRTPDDAKKFIIETQLEVENITNQIKDYTELLDISKKIDQELEVDPDWIIKAQYARRIKLNHINIVKQWLVDNQPAKNQNNKDLVIRLSLLEQQIESIKKKLEKERQCRSNVLEEHRKQIGFSFRAIRELYKVVLYLINTLNISTPSLITQTQLNWVDDVISKNPDALLLQKNAK